MFKKTLLLGLLFFLNFCYFSAFAKDSDTESYLRQLDNVIQKRSLFLNKKKNKIDSLKVKATEDGLTLLQQYELNEKLYDELLSFKYDDAMEYALKNREIALKLNDPIKIDKTKIDLSNLLTKAGMYRESLEALKRINREKIDTSLLTDYYIAYEQVYYSIKEYSNDELFSPEYQKVETAYRDSVFNLLDPNSQIFQHYQSKIYFQEGRIEQALYSYIDLMDQLDIEDPLYAIVTYDISQIFRAITDTVTAQKYLAIAAIIDMMTCTTENYALQMLAVSLYDNNPNEFDRMFTYILTAMQDAKFYNSRLRTVQVAEKIPYILNAYQAKRDKSSQRLTILLTTITLLLCAVLGLVWYTLRKIRLIRNIKRQLEELNKELIKTNEMTLVSNKIKEEYIALFSDLCASYIQKLDDFRVTVKRKLVTKQLDLLFQRVNSTFSIEQELNDFFTIFDNAFLKMYPNFVEDFNALLKPEERIELKNGELLNRELRIYALFRLGISDSSKIAAFLHYSPQTIYNNRTKIKNKAINRDTFEDEVLNISDMESTESLPKE